MTRGLAILFAASLLHGQRSAPPAGPTRTWVVDTLALDTQGRPVTDLGPADFEVTLGGRARKVIAFTRFDTVQHAAHASPGMEQALPLTPEENRLIVVAIVDDVGLSPEGVAAVRNDLRAMAETVTGSGGRMAILRSAGGAGMSRQLTGDRRILADAIEGVRYLGGATSSASAGSATWQTLAFALDGLAGTAGRKIVAVITEKPCAPAPQSAVSFEIRHEAHAAAAAVYALRPGGEAIGEPAAVCPLASLAHDTGGHFGGAPGEMLRREQGYYAIGIAQDEDVIDPTGRWSAAKPAEVKVLRAGVTVRPRMGFVQFVAPRDSLLPEAYATVYNRALRSPFDGAAVSARLRVTLIDQRDTAIMQAALHVDPREITFTRDLEGIYHGSAMIGIVVYKENARTPNAAVRELPLILKPDDMRQAMEKGILTAFEMSLPGPGAWQVHAVVADKGSDRIGSAAQFIEVPNLRQSRFGIGGLLLTADRASDPTLRRFRQGDSLNYAYTSINETLESRKASLESQTKVLSGERILVEGAIVPISFEAARGEQRQISGKITLNDRVPPGDYILQVTVRDLLAPAGKPNTATQVIDFQVR